MILVKTGEAMPLNVQLVSGRVGAFPLAYLHSGTGAPIGTPVPLADVGGGLYLSNAVVFPPGASSVIATYVIYDDADHVEESAIDGNGTDIFVLDTFAAPMRVDGFTGIMGSTELTARVEEEIITGTVDPVEDFIGLFSGTELTGQITEETITGTIGA